jgi:hypothetical protein
MATSENNNGFSGRLGNTVTYLLNGQMVMRRIGTHRKPSSPKKRPSQQVTILVNNFLKPIRALVKIGFQQEAIIARKTGYTMATIFTRANAIKGVYPEQEIDFEKVMFTRGNLPATENVTAIVVPGGILFSWDHEAVELAQHAHDRSILIAYNVDTGAAYYELNGNRRHQGSDTLYLPNFKHKVKLQTYIAFISANQLITSNSLYVGILIV